MKIALISPQGSSLQNMKQALDVEPHTVVLVEGAVDKLRAVAEQERPDLILLDGLCRDPEELRQVETVTSRHPAIAVILLCATHTPEFLLDAMRVGIREVLPSPAAALAIRAAVSRVAAKLLGAQTHKAGKVLAFISCKGGSGATFLATNLGYQLAETRSVLLIDLNLQFGDALSFLHDGAPVSTLADVARDMHRLDASLLAASAVKIADNYSILAAPEEPSQALEVKPDHIDAILNLAITQYDFVLLDVGRTIDPLTIKALDHAFRIFPVLQAELPYLRNAKKLLSAFDALGYPPEKIEPIVNRFSKRGEIGIEQVSRLLGKSHLHTVPNSYKDVSASINQGNPLLKMARTSAVSRILAEFTEKLSPRQEDARGLFGRLFGRV